MHQHLKNNLAIILIFGSLFLWILSPLARAQSPSPAPTTDPSIKEKVEERLQKVLNEQTDRKRGFAGEIRNIGNTLEIKTKSDTKQLLPSETDLEIVGLKKEKLAISDLEIGSFVIAMGYLTDQGALDTRRIVVTAKPKESSKVVIFGTVSDLTNDGENILTIASLKGDEETIYEVETNTKTTISSGSDKDSEEMKFSDLAVDDRVVIIGTANSKNALLITATTIHIVPAAVPTNVETAEDKTASPAPSTKPITTPLPTATE